MIPELQVLLAGLLIYAGVPLGMLLVYIAPEEKKPYQRILRKSRQILLILFFAVALALSYPFGLTIVAFTALAAIIAFIWWRRERDNFVHASLAIPLSLFAFRVPEFLTLAVLAILYGMLAGILETDRKKKNYPVVLLRYTLSFPVFVAFAFLI